jgi:hypothetical protein
MMVFDGKVSVKEKIPNFFAGGPSGRDSQEGWAREIPGELREIRRIGRLSMASSHRFAELLRCPSFGTAPYPLTDNGESTAVTAR